MSWYQKAASSPSRDELLRQLSRGKFGLRLMMGVQPPKRRAEDFFQDALLTYQAPGPGAGLGEVMSFGPASTPTPTAVDFRRPGMAVGPQQGLVPMDLSAKDPEFEFYMQLIDNIGLVNGLDLDTLMRMDVVTTKRIVVLVGATVANPAGRSPLPGQHGYAEWVKAKALQAKLRETINKIELSEATRQRAVRAAAEEAERAEKRRLLRELRNAATGNSKSALTSEQPSTPVWVWVGGALALGAVAFFLASPKKKASATI